MKKYLPLMFLTGMLAFGSPAAEPQSGHLSNMGRGLVNVTTCFLEVPRCMVYRNSLVPFWGFVDGAVRGAGLTALRAFSGVTDLLFLGFDYGRMYNRTDFCDYVWQSPWQPAQQSLPEQPPVLP